MASRGEAVMPGLGSLSVVIPAYDEAARIAGSVARVAEYLRSTGMPHEILVVDDGSTDGTADAAREGAEVVVVLRTERNLGKGAAVRAGVGAARHDWVLVTDADQAVPITELPSLAARTGEADVVVGSKRMTGSAVQRARARRLGSAAAQLVVRALVVRGFRDTQCGFKLMRSETAKRLFRVQELDGYGYDFEVLYLAKRYGVAVSEVPVRGSDPGTRRVRPSAYASTLAEAVRVARNRLVGAYPPSLPPA